MIRKLRFKFVFINMSIVTLMLCVIFGLVFYFTRAGLEQESIRMMQNVAGQPFQTNLPSERGEEVRLPFFTLQLDPYGNLVSAGGGYYDLSDQEFLDSLAEIAFSSPRRLGVIEEYNLRYYRADTPLRPCVVFADISSEVTTLSHLTRTCLILGAISFFVFLWGSVLLSKWAVKPVDQAWKQQRDFVAAASHELKTPLTVIITNAELLQSPDYEEDKRETFLTSILTMSSHMRRLIEQMLELARAEGTESRDLFRPVDFSQLVSSAALPFESAFFEAGLSLSVEAEEHIQVTGDAAQLRQVVEILLDNARKYSRERGATQVSLRRHGRDHCVLCVADEGAPIPHEELQNIFKRFYRADPARSRTGSFGLGLSIAQSIVTRHQGKIWAESQDGMNRFFVELPCS